MRVVMFYHSLLSDWNHGNAHFLRGVASELLSRGHEVRVYEPLDSWSLKNLRLSHGRKPIDDFRRVYPGLDSTRYRLDTLDLDEALDGVDLVLVHGRNPAALVQRIGRYRARAGDFVLLFHDTHHRAVTNREQMAAYDLRDYDGVLAFGRMIRDFYLLRHWAARAWTWHEAADVRVFHPMPGEPEEGDVVWIGNWGDDERTAELNTFLVRPVRELGLRCRVHGVRYPARVRVGLAQAGIEYRGFLPNFEVPRVFARFRVTVHIPRRPYAEAVPGIPTIRPFEAMACGIPLVCSPWEDLEGLFVPGRDFLVARTGLEMARHLRAVVEDASLARELSEHGRRIVLARHTCAHRVDELLAIHAEVKGHETHVEEPIGTGHEPAESSAYLSGTA
jgi:spore maturation protein CgeB